MKKRIVSLLLCVAMLLSLMPTVFAAGEPTVTIASVDAMPGDTGVAVTLSIANNPGVAGVNFAVSYDTAALTLKNVAYGPALTDTFTFTKPGNLRVSPINVYGEAMDESTDDGVFATLTFDVAPDAAAGFYAITATYNAGDVYNGDLDDVDVAIVDGGITVGGSEPVHEHSYTPAVTTAATCTTAGVLTYTCACGDSYTETIPATGHAWDAGVVTTQPTTTSAGVKTYTCQNDPSHTRTEVIPQLPAGPAITIASVEADKGATSVAVTMTISGNPGLAGVNFAVSYDTAALTLKNITYGPALTDTFTFTKPGKLNVSPINVYGEAMDESTGDGVFATLTFDVASNAAAGLHAITATYDEGDVYNGDLDDVELAIISGGITVPGGGPAPHEHTWDDGVVTTQPTCTEAGVKTYSCSGCDETYTETIPALGHTSAAAVQENVIAATCETAGSYDEVIYCSVCRAELSRTTKTIAAKGHAYNAGVVTTAPTCTTAGVKTYTCSNDRTHTYTETIPATGHNWDAGVVTTQPTTTSAGVMTYTCQNDSSHTYTEVIPPIPAGPAITIASVEADKGATSVAVTMTISGNPGLAGVNFAVSYDTAALTLKNITYGPALTDTFTFTKPGKLNVSPINVYGEAMDESTGDGVFATLTFDVASNAAAGLHAITATYDEGDVYNGDLDDVELAIISGGITVPGGGPAPHEHTWDDGVVTTQPTCTEAGVKTYSCSGCDETYTETIPALGHTPAAAVQENIIAATCTTAGSYDEVVYCETCHAELSRETKTIEATGHNYDAVITAPTCTEYGYTTYTCTVCGDSYTDTYVAATGHAWDEGYVTTQPTCEVDGVKTYTCVNDPSHTYTETVPATGHAWDEGYVTTQPTCEVDGVKTYTCVNDPTHTYTETVPATGHAWDEGYITTQPTCEVDGVKTYTCVNDSSHTYTETVPATGHNYDEGYVTTQPTCEVDGVKTYTCLNDSTHTYTETVPATGHAWDEGVVTTEPTKTSAGIRTYTCLNDASHTYTEEIPPLPLEPTVTLSNATAKPGATGVEVTMEIAENPGIAGVRFAVSYDTAALTLKNITYGPALTNQITFTKPGNLAVSPINVYGEGLDASNTNGVFATLTFDVKSGAAVGAYAITATYAPGAIYDNDMEDVDVVIVNGSVTVEACEHVWNAGVVTTQPTCTEDGVMTYTCTICGATMTDAIPATGHTPAAAVQENIIAATCTTAGSYDEVVYCETCHAELSRETKTIPATGHNYDAVITAPTCTEDGYTTYTCTVCGDSYTDTYVAATGHAWDEGVITTQPTCTEAGVKTYTCANDSTHIYTEPVPAPGHAPAAAVQENVIAATCEVAGSYDEVVYCETCHAELSRETKTIEALGHDLVHHAAQAATCEAAGWAAYDTCSRCDYTTYAEIPATGHVWDDGVVTVQPTKTTPGVKTYTCQNDPSHTYTEEIPPLPLEPTVTISNVTAKPGATGVEVTMEIAENPGIAGVRFAVSYDTAALTLKNITYGPALTDELQFTKPGYLTVSPINVYGDAMDASYSNGVFATLTFDVKSGAEAGDYAITATYAPGDVYDGNTDDVDLAIVNGSVTVEACEHVWNAGVVTTAASCTTDGVMTYTCTICGATMTDVIPATGHTPAAAVQENVIAATCETAGSYDEVVYCETCHAELSRETKTIAALGHAWNEGVVTTQPTCEGKGVKTYTCQNDNTHTYTEEIAALGHDIVHHAAQAATCTEKGWNAYDTCSRCDYTTYVEIAALGHDIVHHEAQAATCTEKGWNAYDTCSRCDYTTYVEIAALGHNLVHHAAQAATCEAAGWAAYDTCSRCDYTTYAEIPALGHNWNNGVVTTQPTTTTPGVKTYTCQNDPSHTYTEEIPPIPVDPTLTVVSGTAKPGEDIAVALTIADNSGIAGMRIAVAYDSALTLKNATAGSAFSSLVFTSGSVTANPVVLLWDGQDADTSNGTIAVLTFKVSESAAEGDYPITVSYVNGDVYDDNMNNISIAVVNGKVTVEQAEIKNGIYFEDGAYYYYENSVRKHPGLVYVDGYYYYIKSDCTAVTNITRYVDVNHTNGLLEAGNYTFDAEGKLVFEIKNGVYLEGGVYYYYVDNVKTHAGLIKFGDDYYYVKSGGVVETNTTRTIDANHTNGLLPAGSYTFGADGKLIVIKNGIYEEGGKLYYYVNNAKTHAGLIKLGDDYYYVKSGGVVETNTTRNIDANHTNGLLPVGSYEIGADGKLKVIKNGIFYENGTYYYYQNDAKAHVGLFKYYDGYYYYAKTGGVIVTSTTRYVDAQHSNGYPYGNYTFGADGKAEVKNGIVEEDGGLYYYVSGTRTHAGLIQIGSYIYYVKTGGAVVTSTTRYVDERHSNGKVAGIYTFDSKGRAENKSGIIYENGAYYYYVQGAMLHAGLVKVDGYYYYIKSDCTAVTNTTRYVDENHNNGLLPVGNYTFGADGKMQTPLDGIIYENGAYYYYVNGVRSHPGLIVVDGYYYYVKSDCTAVTSTTRSIDTYHANGLLPAGTYTFNAVGQIVDSNGNPLVAG